MRSENIRDLISLFSVFNRIQCFATVKPSKSRSFHESLHILIPLRIMKHALDFSMLFCAVAHLADESVGQTVKSQFYIVNSVHSL